MLVFHNDGQAGLSWHRGTCSPTHSCRLCWGGCMKVLSLPARSLGYKQVKFWNMPQCMLCSHLHDIGFIKWDTRKVQGTGDTPLTYLLSNYRWYVWLHPQHMTPILTVVEIYISFTTCRSLCSIYFISLPTTAGAATATKAMQSLIVMSCTFMNSTSCRNTQYK